MATIGLDKLFYSKITENENGEETYATPVPLAKAMTAELSIELAEATGSGFPTLALGENKFILGGGVTSLSVFPRWCTL